VKIHPRRAKRAPDGRGEEEEEDDDDDEQLTHNHGTS